MSRPETVRAMRIAAVTASDPVLQNAARSMPTMLADHLRDFAGERRLRADLDAGVELRLDGVADEVGVVPEEDHAEAVGHVDVLVAVDIPELRARGAH